MKTRRIEVTFERTERILTRRKRGGDMWCVACRATVRMLTPGEAATLARVAPQTIYGWVETGRLHRAQVPDGTLLICPNSLVALDESCWKKARP